MLDIGSVAVVAAAVVAAFPVVVAAFVTAFAVVVVRIGFVVLGFVAHALWFLYLSLASLKNRFFHHFEALSVLMDPMVVAVFVDCWSCYN